MLVVKGQMELDEVHNFWKQKTHVVCTVYAPCLPEVTAVPCDFGNTGTNTARFSKECTSPIATDTWQRSGI
jgi:hypothetical protein